MPADGRYHASPSGDGEEVAELDQWKEYAMNAGDVQAWAFSDDESLPCAEDAGIPWDDRVRAIITGLVSCPTW